MARSESKPDPWELLLRYQERYDIPDEDSPALRLQRTLHRRKARAFSLQRRVDELESMLADTLRKLKTVEDEIEGSWRTAELYAQEMVDAIKRKEGEGWSPIPVHGYRMWVVRGNGLHGAMTRWRTPDLSSVCLNQVRGEDIPHSVRKCGPPPCGIYATKDLAVLRRELGVGDVDGYVIGVVALEGKVIEHARGYRGAKARVAAVTARFDGRFLHTDAPKAIEALFDDPGSAIKSLGEAGKPGEHQGHDYLNQWKEQNDTWTWETKSES